MRRILMVSILFLGLAAVVSFGRRGARIRHSVQEPASGGGAAQSAGLLRADSIIRARERSLQRIAESDTYLSAMLVQSDSILKRWSDRTNTPLAVYLPDGGAPGY